MSIYSRCTFFSLQVNPKQKNILFESNLFSILLVCVIIITSITAIIQMLEPEIVLNRICECINDLGLLLDQIYKFPQKQREQYFDRIQNMKNKLLLLKSNFRDNNLISTEKQYKQIYLAMNTLKNDIQQQTTLMPVFKENRESNRFKEIKDVKKNYEEAMKLLLSKDEETNSLKNLLFEKQQLIRINFEDLNKIKHEHQILLQANRLSKYSQTSIEIDYQSVKTALIRTQSELMELKIRQQEKDKAFNSAICQLQQLKSNLIEAREKLNYYEELAQLNMAKTLLAEQNKRKAEKQAIGLNQNYKHKQYDNFKKLREISEFELDLKGKIEMVRQLEQQNKRCKEDLQVLQNQITRLQKSNEQSNRNFRYQKDKWQLQKKSLEEDIKDAARRQNELKKLLEESDKKYLLTIGKLNASEELKVKLKESQCRNQLIQQKNTRLQSCIQDCRSQMDSKQRQKQSILLRLEKQLHNLRQFQIQICRLKQKLKSRDEQRVKLISELQSIQIRLKDYERMKMMLQIKQKQRDSQLREQKTKAIKLQQKYRVRDKQIQTLKVKLLRAKIQTVHQIREVIN